MNTGPIVERMNAQAGIVGQHKSFDDPAVMRGFQSCILEERRAGFLDIGKFGKGFDIPVGKVAQCQAHLADLSGIGARNNETLHCAKTWRWSSISSTIPLRPRTSNSASVA